MDQATFDAFQKLIVIARRAVASAEDINDPRWAVIEKVESWVMQSVDVTE